jgi:hypothetical protein
MLLIIEHQESGRLLGERLHPLLRQSSLEIGVLHFRRLHLVWVVSFSVSVITVGYACLSSSLYYWRE